MEYQLKELQESMNRCTCSCSITEIQLKTALNTIQSVNFTAVHYFKDGYVGKQPVTLKVYFAEYWSKEL